VSNNPLLYFDPDGLEQYVFWVRIGGFLQTNLISVGDPTPLIPLAVKRSGMGTSPRNSNQPGRLYDKDKGLFPNAGPGPEMQNWVDRGNKVMKVYVTFTIDKQTNVDKDGNATTTISIVSANITWGESNNAIGPSDVTTQMDWAGHDPNTTFAWSADLSQLSDEQLAAVRSAVASNPRAPFLNPFLLLIDMEIARREQERRRVEEEREKDKKKDN
jgi:hypothetical protein